MNMQHWSTVTNLPVKSRRPIYAKLDKDVKEAGCGSSVIFDETQHLEMPFQSNVERFRFFLCLAIASSC